MPEEVAGWLCVRVSMVVCVHTSVGVGGGCKCLCFARRCLWDMCCVCTYLHAYRLHNGLNQFGLSVWSGRSYVHLWMGVWVPGPRDMCAPLVWADMPLWAALSKRGFSGIFGRYPRLGLWEEGRGFCCLYPPSPPSAWGWCVRASVWGLGDSGLGHGSRPDPRPGVILRTSLCPPHSPGPSSHIKPSLCQAGGREPQRVAGGGEEEVAHPAREHLEAFEGGPAATRPALWGWTLGRSSLLLPAGRPPPQAPPPQPQLPLTPATSKEAEGESEQRGDPGLAGLGWGPCISKTWGRSSPPTDRQTRLPGWIRGHLHSVYPVFRLSVQDSQIVQ